MQALRIEWTETEAGWGQRPDGYSFHTTAEAASEFLSAALARLPDHVPDEYDYPSEGWRLPAKATPVELPEDSLIAKSLKENGSTRVWRSFSGENGDRYTEAKRVEVDGETVEINYGQTPYSAKERTEMQVKRMEVEAHVTALQTDAKPPKLG